MSESENLQNLKEISSTVSERDLKIWENVAHSLCIQKQTEKLKSEIAQMKAATVEKKKENETLEDQLREIVKTIDIQKDTLIISERSVVMQTTYRDSLLQFVADSKKKYAATLEMYNDELKVYREIYENASQDYKELKAKQTEMKKLEVEKMMMEVKVENLVRSQKQFRDIQKMIFYTTMVTFAEFYTLYHRRDKLKRLVGESKKEEQQLLKEHLRLAEEVKQKKMQYQKRMTQKPSFDRANAAKPAEPKERREAATDKLQNFLKEEILPCSLTSLDSTSRVVANNDKSKVRILDDRILKQVPPRAPPVRKSNPELRKKMEDIMQAAKNEVRRSNSFQSMQRSSQNSQKTLSQQSVKTGAQQTHLSQQGSQIKANSQQIRTASQIKANSQQQMALRQQPRSASQESKQGRMRSSQDAVAKTEEFVRAQASTSGVTNSILKPSSQSNVDVTNVNRHESVSKFFNPLKKTVTFQNETQKQAQPGKFQLFSMEERKSESAPIGKSLDVFHKPFTFGNEDETKREFTESTPETGEGALNVSFSGDTAPTNFSTFGDVTERRTELTFDLETSFGNRNFVQPPLEQPPVDNPTTGFSFFGSQAKSNPFSFF